MKDDDSEQTNIGQNEDKNESENINQNERNTTEMEIGNTKLSFEPLKTIDAGTLEGKVICGYQGWFGTSEDGYSERGWMHWSGKLPSIDRTTGKQSVSFEMFPDLYEYEPNLLTKINFDNLPDSRSAALFSSYNEETVDLHFKWMQEYGIDGVALQRFLGEALGGRSKHVNTVAEHVKKASEKYGRIFYICYDFSGANNADYVASVKRDFENNIEGKLDLISSERYLHHRGKPVIQLWGMGVNGNYKRSAEESVEIIRYFKEKGYYVIGGTPSDWRKDSGDGIPGFADVYAEFDMISPWTVGRFGKASEAKNHYKTKIIPDINYLYETEQDYMPVLFAGFAWSLWNGGAKNHIPRKAGELLRTQMELAAELNPMAIYIAMFDEYDEATAIMKAASDSSEIPSNSYFLTTSADGIYVSSDYYLRLTGTFTKNFRNKENLEIDSVPFSVGSIWFRTGFEKDTDAQIKSEVNENEWADISVIETDKAHNNKYALSIKGNNTGNASFPHTIHEINATVGETTTLSYFIYFENNSTTADISISCEFDDGTSSDFAVPNREIVNQWQEVKHNIGESDGAKGKTITSIVLRCTPNTSDTAAISILIDDVSLEDK